MTHNRNSPVITHARVLKIAVPMTFAYLTTPLIGLVDIFVIGQLGNAAAIGGIGVGALIFNVIFNSLNFLRLSTTAMTAQAIGSGAPEQAALILYRALLLSLGIGLIAIVFYSPITSIGLKLIRADPEVNEIVWVYMGIRILAAPLTLMNFTFAGWLMGMARSWFAFIQQSLLNIANIIASVVFVMVFDMGVVGVALGTLVGEVIGIVTSLVMMGVVGRQDQKAIKRPAWVNLLDRVGLKRMMVMNGDLLVRSFVLLASFFLFTSVSARLGTNVLAANEVLLQFFYVAGYFLDGCAVAAEQLGGQAFGAKDRKTFRKAVQYTAFWNGVMAIGLALSFVVIIPLFIGQVTPNLQVQTIALGFMAWAVVTPLTGVLAFQMDGVFFGAGWSDAVRNQMLTSMVVLMLSVALFVYGLGWGNHGLWLAFNIFLASRGLFLLLLYKRYEQISFKGA